MAADTRANTTKCGKRGKKGLSQERIRKKNKKESDKGTAVRRRAKNGQDPPHTYVTSGRCFQIYPKR